MVRCTWAAFLVLWAAYRFSERLPNATWRVCSGWLHGLLESSINTKTAWGVVFSLLVSYSARADFLKTSSQASSQMATR